VGTNKTYVAYSGENHENSRDRATKLKYVIHAEANAIATAARSGISVAGGLDLRYEKGTYLAFELSEESRAKLLRMFKPKFSKVICHHVTIEFNLTLKKYENFVEIISTNPKVRVIGIAEGDGIECIAVSIDGETERADGSFYHVTLSLEPPHKPVESNNLKQKVNKIRGIIEIDGSFKLLKK
jgi:phage gp37-like protein